MSFGLQIPINVIVPSPSTVRGLAKAATNAQLDWMESSAQTYKPWPKCPKCSLQMMLIPPKEKGGTPDAYECLVCDFYWHGEPKSGPKVVR